MNKTGEIGRIKHNNVWYIIEANSEPYKGAHNIIAFNIYASRKSARNRDIEEIKKKYTGWNAEKRADRQYNLGGGDIVIIRELLNVIKKYLSIWKPKYLGISAFSEDDWVKRMNFYIISLARMGYEATGHYDRVNEPGTLVFAPKGSSKKVFVKAGYSEEKNDFYFEEKNGKRSYIEW